MYFPKHLLKDKVELVVSGRREEEEEGGRRRRRRRVYDSVKWLRSGGITMPISR